MISSIDRAHRDRISISFQHGIVTVKKWIMQEFSQKKIPRGVRLSSGEGCPPIGLDGLQN